MAHDDECDDLLPIGRVRYADRGRFQHCGVPQQRFIDLARRDVLAAFDDQFLRAPGDVEVAVRVAVAEVAVRSQPSCVKASRVTSGAL